jgi:hypothetical protein
MRAQSIKEAFRKGRAGTAARRTAVIAATAALAACATAGGASAARSGPDSVARSGFASAARTITVYAFDINNGASDPGFIPVAGTSASTFVQGDELIVNDQLTTTHKVNGGYPIVGKDAGVCTLTRLPEPHVSQTLGNCVVTLASTNGSILTIQGIVKFVSQQPQAAVLAVTGGTGQYAGAAGSVNVSFTKNFKILVIHLR